MVKDKLPESAAFFSGFNCFDYFMGAKIDYADIITAPVGDVSMFMVKADAFRGIANCNSGDSLLRGYVDYRNAIILRVSGV